MRHLRRASVIQLQTITKALMRKPISNLRTGFTTGACATAASKAATSALLGQGFLNPVQITLPRGETPAFELVEARMDEDVATASVRKDAGDDPDVTHGALIIAHVRLGTPGQGVAFRAGPGVGQVTMPGLPIPVGEPAINPVPRQMMTEHLTTLCAAHARPADLTVTIEIPGGEALAAKTWNPRLGIEGGLSILGTTGIVRPFSCAAWIASIHRGIDVARAAGLSHVIGSTGATSERVAQARFGLPDHAMLDMGDFVGGMLKYLRRNPVERVTIAGGFGKLTKLAQGALDLHSARSQVDLGHLADLAGLAEIASANTAMQALEIAGNDLAAKIAQQARKQALEVVRNTTTLDVLIISRDGTPIAFADASGARVL